MNDRLRGSLSAAIGFALLLRSVAEPFGFEEGFALTLGVGNLLMAVWLFSEAQP